MTLVNVRSRFVCLVCWLTVGYKLGSLVITPAFVQSIATSAYGLLFYVWQSSHDHGSTIVKLVTRLTEAQEQRLTELLFIALANDTTTRDMCDFSNLTLPEVCGLNYTT